VLATYRFQIQSPDEPKAEQLLAQARSELKQFLEQNDLANEG